MGSSEKARREQLAGVLAPQGQDHLLKFWDELTAQEREKLAGQIESLDFDLLRRLVRSESETPDWGALARRAQPPTAVRLHSERATASGEARRAGETALRDGQVGAILVAGGQGTRLTSTCPKGMYEVGPLSGATLYQILLEKLVAVRRRYGAAVPLYLMTSPATHAETVSYLAAHDRFGLPEEAVRVFCQGQMPAVDAASGRVLLASKSELALSPDGHGGMLAALAGSGGLSDIQRRGVKHLFYFQVDNPLVEMCEPTLLGHHILARSEMSTLVVAKRNALERMGNVVQIDGRTRIVEYSDWPPEVAQQREPDGSLRLWAGSTAIHVLDAEFLARTATRADALPFHVAKKSVPCIGEKGEPLTPAEPNAIKFERFIFDLLPLAERAIAVEADRARTFAPVKNAWGAAHDTLETCQAAMIELHRQWLQSAGAEVGEHVPVEISPLFAVNEVELREKVPAGARFDQPTYLR